MRQQINLYQPIFSEERKPFSAGPAALVLSLLVAALAAFTANGTLEVRNLEREAQLLRAQQAERDLVSDEHGETPSLDVVEARVEKLGRLVAERRQGLEILRSGAAGTTSGFAPRLEALARRHVNGLWIEAMHLSGTSGAMTLSGQALDPDTVPAYLRSLALDEVLAGTRFDDFVIERPIAGAAAHDAQAGDKDGIPSAAKRTDPKLVKFRAGSTLLKRSETQAGTEGTS